MNKSFSFLDFLTNSKEKKIVLGNFFSLSFLQFANYVLPLVTLPYLVRVLGVSNFGLIAFVQAFIQYFVIVTDYGFGFTATRDIAINRDDPRKVSEIFSNVMGARMLLALVSLIIIGFVVVSVPKFRENWLVYLFTYGLVLDSVLFPSWFFQGMERMKYISIRNISAKIIFTFSIFIFVRKPSDYLYVPLINSLGILLSGGLTLIFLFRNFRVKFYYPSLITIYLHLKDGWAIFISLISINLYTTTNTFVLGLLTNNTVVGIYSAGEKIINVINQLFRPFAQAAYPFITKLASESRDSAIRKIRLIFKVTFIISFFSFLILFLFANQIVAMVLGNNFSGSIEIVRVLSPLLIIVPLAGVLANLSLLPFKLDKYFSRIYMVGGIANLVLLFTFLYIFSLEGRGAAWANVFTEVGVTFAMFIILKKNKITVF
jgi:polysaccharide transporter, PST family